MSRLGLLLIPLLLWGQPQFFGYFETEADGLALNGEQYIFGYHKLRLEVEARPSDKVLIGANLNVQRYWGKTRWNLLDFLPPGSWYALTENFGYVIPFELPDTLLLDNIYMRLSFPLLDLTLGRQQISPGVGYAWNPTDIFNKKTLLDPSYEQTGVDAIKADVPLGTRSNLSFILQPRDSWDSSTRQVSAKTRFGRFDLGVLAAEYDWIRSRHLLWGFPPEETRRQLTGATVVGEIWSWGIWSEMTYNKLNGDDDFSEVLLGLDHTFDNSLYFLMEALHNGNGDLHEFELTFDDYLLQLNGETHSLMQDYAFFYASHPTFDYVSISALSILNFNDQSGTIAPQIDWNVFENTNISLQGSLFWGDPNSEFGLQDWGLRLRLRSDF